MLLKGETWKRAMLTLSLDKFSDTDLSRSQMLALLKNLDSDKLKIITFIEPNIVIFKKRSCDYDFIGRNFEKWLFKHFKLKEVKANETRAD